MFSASIKSNDQLKVSLLQAKMKNLELKIVALQAKLDTQSKQQSVNESQKDQLIQKLQAQLEDAKQVQTSNGDKDYHVLQNQF